MSHALGRRFPTKRFVLYLVLIPIIAPLVTGVWQALMYGGYPFDQMLQLPGLFLWSAYFNWLLLALAVAVADRLVRSDKWQRLATIAAGGCVSTRLTEVALFDLPLKGWRWGHFLPGLIGAIAAVVCCLLLDQLNKERLSNLAQRSAA